MSKVSYKDFKDALALHAKFLIEIDEDRPVFKYSKINNISYLVTYLDTLVDIEPEGYSQLGATHFLMDEGMIFGPHPAAVVEFITTEATRVARISMAAESYSLNVTIDRHIHARLILDILLRGI